MGPKLCLILCFVVAPALGVAVQAQDAKQIVQRAVTTELAANELDHSKWIYFEIDRKPKSTVTQWVAETPKGDVRRVLETDGQQHSKAEQVNQMESFLHSTDEQAQRRKAGQHDDQETTELLKLLPVAFVWTVAGNSGGRTVLHFKPDANYDPQDREARVFGAMEGDMTVDNAQHRIVSLKGRLTRDVKFGWGLFAALKAGGTFQVERRELAPTLWKITETHIHIEGYALLFKNISEQEDDEKTKFQQLPDDVSLAAAEKNLMQRGE